jgi:hypothetical protein
VSVASRSVASASDFKTETAVEPVHEHKIRVNQTTFLSLVRYGRNLRTCQTAIHIRDLMQAASMRTRSRFHIQGLPFDCIARHLRIIEAKRYLACHNS